MKKILQVSLLIGLFIMLGSTSVTAQKVREAKKYDDPEWKRVVLIDYKAGQANRAREIVRDYYAPASKNAGTPGPQMVMEMHSGEYDIMAIWAMEGGIEDMNWDIHPNNIKWRNALNELAGGADKAVEIMKEYSGCVNKSTSYIARVE